MIWSSFDWLKLKDKLMLCHTNSNFQNWGYVLLHCLDGNSPPAKVHKVIDDYLGNFLWSGDMSSSKKAKVGWDEICLPKEEVGLGLMKSKSWNKAAMMKHIWKILRRSGTSL